MTDLIISVCHGVLPLGGLLTNGHGYCGRCHKWAEFKEPSRTLQVWPREFSGERDI